MIHGARFMRERAYTPYSKAPVGAAVLGASGNIFLGCTVENATLGLTISAVHGAVLQAVAAGERKVLACAVAVPGRPRPPSGPCCQVLVEFGDPSLAVAIVGKGKARQIHKLSDLIPEPFNKRWL